jgi:hypothetical protein
MTARLSDLTFALGQLALLAEGKQAGIDKLDGATRAKVLAALAALIILGFGLVVLAWMGARFTRRYMGPGARRPHEPLRTDEWVPKAPKTEPTASPPPE